MLSLWCSKKAFMEAPCSDIPGAYSRGRLTCYVGSPATGEEFSGSAGVAQGSRAGAGDLYAHHCLPEGGDLRLVPANPPLRRIHSGQYRRRIPTAQCNREDPLSQPGRELPGGDTVLSDSGSGSRLWRYRDVDELAGRSQPTAERIQHRHSDFLDSWLLTSISRRDIKGKPLASSIPYFRSSVSNLSES